MLPVLFLSAARMTPSPHSMPNEAQGASEAILGKAAFRIPHSLEVEKQFLEGELFSELCYRESRAFRNEIAKLSVEVFGV